MRLSMVLLCGLLLWLTASAGAAGLPYTVTGAENGVVIQPNVLLAEDVSGLTTLEEMLDSTRFQPASSTQLTPGYSRSAFWLRTSLYNPSAHPVTIWLEAGSARLQQVTLYQHVNGHWQSDDAGTALPFATRPLDTGTPVFPVQLAAGENRELVWRIASETSLTLLPRLWRPEYFRAKEGTDSLLLGFEFGAQIIMALYSLMLFFSLRRRGFAYYALSVLTYMVYEISISGFGFHYLWPYASFWATRIISLSATLSIAFFLLMFRDFLDTRRHVPRWDRFLMILLTWLGLAIVMSLLLDYRSGAQLGTMLSLVVTVSMPLLCLVLLYRGPVGSWAYALASLACMLGNLPRVMEILGWRVSDTMSAYGGQLGSIVGTGLLLTAFTLQVRKVREQKDKAGAALLQLKEQQREQLEQQVIARTMELHQALHEAREANEAKNRLLAHISHDLRAPLSVIIGYTRLLYQPRTDTALCLRAIEDNARHQLALIDELIDFSANHMGEITLRPQDGNWPDFMQGMANDAQQLAAPHGNRFVLQSDGEPPAMLHLDFTRLRQILANLLANAAKFTRDGEIRLTSRARQQDGHWSITLSVSDNGMGMSEHTMARLFQPFQRGDNAQHTQGTGLGLVISAALVKKMGGTLDVSSQLGAGSTFSFCIPLTEADSSAPPAPPSGTTAAYSGQRILLVDDDAHSRRLSAEWLQSAGHQVLEAADGYAALSLLAYHNIDVIVSDQQMPACDGWGLLTALRRQTAAPPILLFSAMAIHRPAQLPDTLAFDAYLQKPADPARLLQCVHGLLPAPEQTMALQLNPEQRNIMSTLLQDGRISDLEHWAQTLAGPPALVAQIRQAVQQLDMTTLEGLAGTV